MSGIIEKEMRGCFDYFWNETNCVEGSPGYGVTRDSTGDLKTDFGSIAATGFALASYAIGVDKGYVSFDDAYKRTFGTLKNIYENAQHNHGFLYHFIHLETGLRYGKSEISIIDTALFLAGAITAGEYFGGEIRTYADKLLDRIDWNFYLCKETNHFHMGYFEEKGFTKAKWDHYAEQFIMYVLATGSDTYPLDASIFYDFERWHCKYGEYEYIRSGPNSLFVYQYSHAFIDFRNTVDRDGIDWFKNSVNATLAHRQYCIDNIENKKTYSDVSWGLSACHYKYGYTGGFGARPFGHRVEKEKNMNDGTIAIYGAPGSIVFAPDICIKTMEHYETYPELWGKYGFKDSYNLHEEPPYFDDLYLGIDKGITITQLANYNNEFVWNYFMKNRYVQKGLRQIGIENQA